MINKLGSTDISKVLGMFLSTCVLVMLGNVANAKLEDDIKERLSPAGMPCVVGEECAVGIAVAGGASTGPKEPEEVYQTFCFACHGTGANNAPKFADVDVWQPRIAKGMDALYESAISGFNNALMPPRGLCMDCSDDDLRATVDYMVEASQ